MQYLICSVGAHQSGLPQGLKINTQEADQRPVTVMKYLSEDLNVFIEWSGIPSLSSGAGRVSHGNQSWIVAVKGEIFIPGQITTHSREEKVLLDERNKIQETIVALYEEQGVEFLKYIKGWFSLVLYDELRRSVLLANDRYAFRPLYYTRIGEAWIFASNLKLLLSTEGIRSYINSLTLLEAAFINFPLGDKTLIENINRLPPASCWELQSGEIRRTRYWNVMSLLESPQLNMRDSLKQGSELFHQVVSDLSSDTDSVGLTLTSGFDGRTILSVINRDRVKVRSFTFGRRNCREAEIARKVASKANVFHELVELEDDFIRGFEKYARRTVTLTDGQATFLRAHYLYAFEQQCKSNTVFLTGIGGSELIRPVHNAGDIYNPNLAALIIGQDPMRALDELLDKIGSIGFFTKEFYEENRRKLNESLIENLVIPYQSLTKNARFLLLNLSEVLPKYFGAEMKLEDSVCIIRPPYLDSDFISMIARSPFSALYNSPFVQSPVARRKGQLFYSYTINSFMPELGGISTDRGYPPILNLLPFGYSLIAPFYFYQKFVRRLIPQPFVDALNPPLWTEELLMNLLTEDNLQHFELFDKLRIHNFLLSAKENPTVLRDLSFVASHLLWRQEVGIS